jgi:hypothetical protein
MNSAVIGGSIQDLAYLAEGRVGRLERAAEQLLAAVAQVSLDARAPRPVASARLIVLTNAFLCRK